MNKSDERKAQETPTGMGALRPRARLLRTLGNDLISSDKVAIIELVKNSYDADATTVILRFQGPLEKGNGRIDVWDDGHGMDVASLQNCWLDIATDSKRKAPRSVGGRRVLGEKGIGRLAAARLGNELTLVTRKPQADEVNLLIDWSQFDREDAYLDEIEVAWEIDRPNLFADDSRVPSAVSEHGDETWRAGHGTLLRIEKLNHVWDEEDFDDLCTALKRLIRPRPAKTAEKKDITKPDFQIIIELDNVAEKIQRFEGAIDPSKDLQVPHYQIRGTVDANGVSSFHYMQQEPAINENIDVKLLWTNEKRSPESGPFEFEINVWDRDNESIQQVLSSQCLGNQSPSVKDIKGFRDTLNALAGVSIYRDGFRVMPFGESGDDWLGLDLRRVQNPSMRLSNNQIIGHIFIGADTNKGLQDQSNREGLLAGTSYSDLQILVRAALSELEQRRYRARRTNKPKQQEKSGLFQRFDLGEIRATLAQSHPTDSHLISLVDHKHSEIQEGVAEMQNVLSRFSRLATLGTLIDRVVHDGRTAVTLVKNIVRVGKRDLEKPGLSDDKKIALSYKAMEDMSSQARMLSLLFNQIEPFGGRRRGRPKKIKTRELINKSILMMQPEADSHGVNLTYQGEDVSTYIDESEALTVLINLIQNAIYWLSRQPRDKERTVIIASRINLDSSLTLIVSDSGPGVADDFVDRIFDPYFSTKPDGIGLGLSIVGNIVENIYDGKLALVSDGPLCGATFEATFRRRV